MCHRVGVGEIKSTGRVRRSYDNPPLQVPVAIGDKRIGKAVQVRHVPNAVRMMNQITGHWRKLGRRFGRDALHNSEHFSDDSKSEDRPEK